MSQKSLSQNLVVKGIRCDDWVNPFGATPEELLASTLEESGLLEQNTCINDCSAVTLFKSYQKKRSLFQDATRLGTLLIKARVITEAQLHFALAEQREYGLPLGELLIQMGYCSPDSIERELKVQQQLREGMAAAAKTKKPLQESWNRLVSFCRNRTQP